MTEEQYLALKGFPFSGFGEPALYKGRQHSDKLQNKVVDRQDQINIDYFKQRQIYREEYRTKVEQGEIKPPTIIERLIENSKGHPDNEQTQAAKRVLEKRLNKNNNRVY